MILPDRQERYSSVEIWCIYDTERPGRFRDGDLVVCSCSILEYQDQDQLYLYGLRSKTLGVKDRTLNIMTNTSIVPTLADPDIWLGCHGSRHSAGVQFKMFLSISRLFLVGLGRVYSQVDGKPWPDLTPGSATESQNQDLWSQDQNFEYQANDSTVSRLRLLMSRPRLWTWRPIPLQSQRQDL